VIVVDRAAIGQPPAAQHCYFPELQRLLDSSIVRWTAVLRAYLGSDREQSSFASAHQTSVSKCLVAVSVERETFSSV
jgi:hypothetical protein